MVYGIHGHEFEPNYLVHITRRNGTVETVECESMEAAEAKCSEILRAVGR